MIERYTDKFIIILALFLAVMVLIKYMDGDPLHTGIFLSENNVIERIVIKRGNPPREVRQGDYYNEIDCRFLSGSNFKSHVDLFPPEYQQSAAELLAGRNLVNVALFCQSDKSFILEDDFRLHVDFPMEYIDCESEGCTTYDGLALHLSTPSSDREQAQSAMIMLNLPRPS